MSKKIRILFLEDNLLDFELVSEYLESEGLKSEIQHATNKAEFERALDSGQFDLILSDYGLPGYSGFAALERALAKDRTLPFILLSGTLSEQEAVESLRAGATDYIIKQRLSRLVPAIRRALDEAEGRRERIRAAEALRLSEERFKLAARATNDVIWEWDLERDEVWCNETFDILFGHHHNSNGFSAQEKISRIHIDDQPRVTARMRDKFNSKDNIWVEEYRFQRRDGGYAYVLDRALICRNESGRPVRMIGAMSDLTERLDAEARIREQAALLDKARDAIVLIDMDQRILYWNKSAERIFGWAEEEALGKKISEFLIGDGLPNGVSPVELLIREHEWRGELPIQTKRQKKIVVESRWSLMRDNGGRSPKGILLINTDVTEKKEIEAQFLRAQRMETIGALSGGIAHDLNNALAPIMMASELLAEEVQSDPGRRMLEMVRASGKRCAEMVKQILSFSRGAGQSRELIDVRKTLEEVAELARETFSKLIVIETQYEPGLNAFEGNLTQVHQVLMNLLVNARDAMMPKGGKLRVSAKNVLFYRHANRMLAEPANGPFISIAVSDTGTGIPPEILDRIFEPFFTTKELGKGTGLGLSTVFSIVKNHGGFLEIRTAVGEGTTFEIFLPAHVARAPGAETAAAPKLTTGVGEELLIVDDEAGLLAIVKTTLETLGYHVTTAADGLEALSILENPRRRIDLVLTDWVMPLMAGSELVRRIRMVRPDLKIVVVSGSSAMESEDFQGLPVAGILQKPYTTESLLQTIRNALTQSPLPGEGAVPRR